MRDAAQLFASQSVSAELARTKSGYLNVLEDDCPDLASQPSLRQIPVNQA